MSKAEELAADLEKHWNTQAPLAVAAELRRLSAERDSLRAVNAEMLEALEHCVDWLNAAGIAETMPVQMQSRAAIASARKLKGEEAWATT